MLGPEFALHEDGEVRVDSVPGGGAEGSPIEREIPDGGGISGVLLVGDSVTGAGRGGEDDLGLTVFPKQVEKRFEGEEFTHADGLDPDPPGSGFPRWDRSDTAETVKKIPSVAAAPEHAEEVPRQREEEEGREEEAVEPYHGGGGRGVGSGEGKRVSGVGGEWEKKVRRVAGNARFGKLERIRSFSCQFRMIVIIST